MSETKRVMAENLQNALTKKGSKKPEGKRFHLKNQFILQNFFTQRTADLIVRSLQSGPPMKFILKGSKRLQMKVVNDCSERGVALIQEYDSSTTKNDK